MDANHPKTEPEQYLFFGCIPRCIEKLAEFRGIPIDRTEFDNLVRKNSPKDYFGLMGGQGMIEILRKFGISKGESLIQDFGEFQKLPDQEKKIGVFLITKKNRDENGNLADIEHCSLVTNQSLSHISTLSPCRSGRLVPENLDAMEYQNREGKFCLFH